MTFETWTRAANRNALLRAERVLTEIRLRTRLAADTDLVAHARNDLRRLADTVDGVIALHARGDDGTCRACSTGRLRRRHRRWPCATLRTVSRAIEWAGEPR